MCEYPFRDTFQTDDKNTYFELIHMKGVFSKFMIYWVDFVYNGDSTVIERDCKDFLKILNKYKISNVKSTGKKNLV